MYSEVSYLRMKVGFPIRKSADRSFFAAPHGLSQRSTSFIASQRQGIHRTPFWHLITLMIDARCGCRPRELDQERPFLALQNTSDQRRGHAVAGRRAVGPTLGHVLLFTI